MKYKIIIVTCLICFWNILIAQNLNHGLDKPQDPATLPRGKAFVKFPELKNKIQPNSRLVSIDDNQWQINGGWELIEAAKTPNDGKIISSSNVNTADWYNAVVPGTILTTLVEQGVYPDPYYGLNNLVIPDSLCRKEWWYRIKFSLPANLTEKKLHLLFNGINYRAEIWLNENKIGRIDGAFIRGKYDVTRLIHHNSENILAVHIYPPDHPGIPHEASLAAGAGPNGGVLCYDGPTFISSEGWDWVPGIRDRNIGIWQDVRLCVSGSINLIDPQVITDLPLPDTTQAAITIETKISNRENIARTFSLAGKIENMAFTKKITLQANETRDIIITPEEFPQLNMKHPRLWWPNRYGKPELYFLKLFAIDEAGDTSDVKTIRFGVRELSCDLSINIGNKKKVRVDYNPTFALKERRALFNNLPTKEEINEIKCPTLRNAADSVLFGKGENKDCAPFLVIKVNGQRIFCKGGNWGMDDGMKRCSRERIEPYIRLHRDEHFTMIRNWTGESTEEVLYELCDEYGLLVYNEFWYSTERYNVDPWDNQLFMHNVRDVVKRFRNHPSIALWGTRNEGYPSVVLEDSLRVVLAATDRTRHYQPGSTFLNLRHSGPWNYMTNQKNYFTNEASGFNTEMGTPSVPTLETIRTFIPEEDIWPINDTWYYHDLSYKTWIAPEYYSKAIENLYGGEVNRVDEYCKRAQLVNYDSYRNMFESYNSKMWNNTSGLLLWMSHPAWPSTMWQTYSYDYETHGAYFGSKKACEPVHVQMNLHDYKIVVINTTLKNYPKAKIILQVCDVHSKVVLTENYAVDIPANTRIDCATAELPNNLPDAYLLRLYLQTTKGALISLNEYWRKSETGKDLSALCNLPGVKLKASVLKKYDGKIIFKVNNPARQIAVAVKMNLRNQKTSERVLPAYFSDGYFNLLPGESKEIVLEYPVQKEDLKITVEGFNVVRQDLIKF